MVQGRIQVMRWLTRCFPSGLSFVSRFSCWQFINRDESRLPAKISKSDNSNPHQGARSKANQATLSVGSINARVSICRSVITGRSPSCSISVALNVNPAACNVGISSVRCFLALTNIAKSAWTLFFKLVCTCFLTSPVIVSSSVWGLSIKWG